MMLPSADRAIADAAKIRDYLLSPEHPIGRFKAAFFEALGYSRAKWLRLQLDLLELGRSGIAQAGRPSAFGQKYEVRGTLYGPSGRRAEVVTVWIVLADEDFPRFVTAFPSEGAMKFKELDAVVLERDVPESGLRKGDLGAIVQTCEPDGVEVEFVAASGRTQALVTLKVGDVRSVMDEDLLSVRPLGGRAAPRP